jgi:hypothetical protein
MSTLFCAFAKCTSLRAVSVAMLGLAGKTKHFQLNYIPKKSTLGNANQRRDAEVFGKVYQKLLVKYSQAKNSTNKLTIQFILVGLLYKKPKI